MKLPGNSQIVGDIEKVVGIVNNVIFEENDPSQRIVILTEHLKTAIKLLEGLGYDEISIRVQNDFPILFSQTESNKEKENKGIIIAPRIKGE